jgi:hypothetical protein
VQSGTNAYSSCAAETIYPFINCSHFPIHLSPLLLEMTIPLYFYEFDFFRQKLMSI